jgi:hypothetical protein
MAADGLDPVLERAVAAATSRSRALAGCPLQSTGAAAPRELH